MKMYGRAFAIAHQHKIEQFLTFKKVSTFEYSVVIFDHTYTRGDEQVPGPWQCHHVCCLRRRSLKLY
jgi:hypothetical protein